MTLKLTRGLWLWAGLLVLALLLVVPFAGWVRAAVAFTVVVLVIRAWIRTGLRFARYGRQLVLAGDAALPPPAYCKPVVLVCGDGLAGLFGVVPSEQLTLRTTPQG